MEPCVTETCYICMSDSAEEPVHRVCGCSLLVHTSCQKKLIEYHGEVHCRVCKQAYTNVDADYVTYMAPRNDDGRQFLSSVCVVVGTPLPLMVVLAHSQTEPAIIDIVALVALVLLIESTFLLCIVYLRGNLHELLEARRTLVRIRMRMV